MFYAKATSADTATIGKWLFCWVCFMAIKLSDEEKKERKKASNAAYALKNKELIAEKARERARKKRALMTDKDRQKKKEYNAEYHRKNKESISARKKEYDEKYYEENKQKILEYQRKYNAENKDKIAKRKQIYRAKNKERRAEYNRAYKLKNPEVKKRSEHKRRALKKGSGGSLSKGITEKLFKLQKGKCPCCKLPLGKNYHIDHIMPLALGGTNTDDNVQLLRATCNEQKQAKHPRDFMWSRGFLL